MNKSCWTKRLDIQVQIGYTSKALSRQIRNTQIILSFCEKVVACFTITRNLAVTTDATVNNLIADLYLRGICIMEKRFDFFTKHTRWIFLIRLKNVKMTKKMIFYIFSSSAKTPLIRVKCQLFKKTLISRPDSFFIILWFKKNVYRVR